MKALEEYWFDDVKLCRRIGVWFENRKTVKGIAIKYSEVKLQAL